MKGIKKKETKGDYLIELIEAKIRNAIDRYEYSEYWNFKSKNEDEEDVMLLITKK